MERAAGADRTRRRPRRAPAGRPERRRSARRSATARGRCSCWPGPARARPGCSPTGSPTCWRPAPRVRARSSRSPSPTRRRARCASGSSALVGRSARAMWVTTFHSACARMLRADAERLGYAAQLHDLRRARLAADAEALHERARGGPETLPAARDPLADLRRQEQAGRRRGLRAGPGQRLRGGRRRRLRALREADARGQRDGLRRPPGPHGQPARALRGGPRALAPHLPPRPRRRVPGHQPRPVPAAAAARPPSTAT